MNYRKIKRDGNHKSIVDYLRNNGVWVYETDKVLTDLITHKNGETGFLELKVKGSAAKYTKNQLRFMATTPAPVAICSNKADALRFARNPREFGLTIKQKLDLLAFINIKPKSIYTPKEIETVLKIEGETE